MAGIGCKMMITMEWIEDKKRGDVAILQVSFSA
jgi:hypothetical protein